MTLRVEGLSEKSKALLAADLQHSIAWEWERACLMNPHEAADALTHAKRFGWSDKTIRQSMERAITCAQAKRASIHPAYRGMAVASDVAKQFGVSLEFY